MISRHEVAEWADRFGELVRIEPAERRLDFSEENVSLRYSDLSAAVRYKVPSRDSFVAMKTAAWRERHTPRDLFDLAGLAAVGAITDAANDLLWKLTGVGFVGADFARVPRTTAFGWEAELRHQVGVLPNPERCLEELRFAVGRLRGS